YEHASPSDEIQGLDHNVKRGTGWNVCSYSLIQGGDKLLRISLLCDKHHRSSLLGSAKQIELFLGIDSVVVTGTKQNHGRLRLAWARLQPLGDTRNRDSNPIDLLCVQRIR